MTAATWLSVLTLVAILLGPILAVQVEKYIERRRQVRARRLHLFHELMATRGSRLSPRHVEALNTIELLFDPKDLEDKKVLDAWKEYLDALNNQPTDSELLKNYYVTRDDLFFELLHVTGVRLGIPFDKVAIKRNCYTPIAFGEYENDWMVIRKALVKMFTNKSHAVPIRIVGEEFEGAALITAADFAAPQPPDPDTSKPR
jgi:hypothetical protein